MIHHPFERLPPGQQKNVFIVLFILTVFLMITLQLLGVPLQTEMVPQGIVSFELAGDLTEAQNIVGSWGEIGKIYAGLNLGIDFLFLILYASSIALGCILTARSLSPGVNTIHQAGILLAWGQFAAALLDSLENYALIRVLLGSQNKFWPIMARWCAIPKFLLVAAGLLFIFLGAIIILGKKIIPLVLIF